MLDSLLSFALSALAFVTVLSVVVFVHEFGHFQIARWCKVAIDTFSIGFGRTLLGWRDRQGVLWKIGALPLGGYVKFKGDADPSSLATTAADDPAAYMQARAQGLFHAQTPAVRALVAFAGPGANFAFSIVAFALIAMIFGQNVTDTARLPARIDAIQTGSAGEAAGFKVNDVVVAVNGARVATLGDLRAAVSDNAGVALTVTVRRDGGTVDLMATPAPAEEVSETGVSKKVGRLGIGPTPRPDELQIVHPDPVAALGFGATQTWRLIASTGGYVANMITGKASADHLAGPLGIAQMTGQVANNAVQEGSWLERLGNLCASLASLAALLSVAVGIVNLLPIPILDGGMILFCAIEAARGRPLTAKAQEFGFRAGLAAIASLFLFATWNDLQRLNILEFLRGMLS